MSKDKRDKRHKWYWTQRTELGLYQIKNEHSLCLFIKYWQLCYRLLIFGDGWNFDLWRRNKVVFIVQLLIHVRLFVTLWPAAHQVSLSFTISWSLLQVTSIESLMQSNHPVLCIPFFSCPQSFPSSGSFPVSQLFTSGGQIIGALASVLPMNIQDWFPLGWTGLISLQSKGLSRVFSNTTVQKHQFFGAQLSL